MADVPKLKSNQRSNVERLDLWVITIGNENWETWFLLKGTYENWQECG